MRSIHTGLPEWMTHGYLEGNEDPAAGGAPTGDGASGTGDQGDKSGDAGAGGDGDGGDDPKDPEDTTGLKSALQKERDARKALEKAEKSATKELKEAQARLKEIDDKDKTASEKAEADRAAAQLKLDKLAVGYRSAAVNSAIEKLAREFKFKDPEDAITGINLSAIEVEQDEDDPAKVTIDLKAAKAAVKALAEKKPYLVGEEDAGDASGSKFGGGKKSSEAITKEKLLEKYPSLRR